MLKRIGFKYKSNHFGFPKMGSISGKNHLCFLFKHKKRQINCFNWFLNVFCLIKDFLIIYLRPSAGAGRCVSSSGHSWPIRQGYGGVGQGEWPAALCLNEYQSCLPGWAATPPSPHSCDWSRGDQPAVASESHFINVHSLTTMRLNS